MFIVSIVTLCCQLLVFSCWQVGWCEFNNDDDSMIGCNRYVCGRGWWPKAVKLWIRWGACGAMGLFRVKADGRVYCWLLLYECRGWISLTKPAFCYITSLSLSLSLFYFPLICTRSRTDITAPGISSFSLSPFAFLIHSHSPTFWSFHPLSHTLTDQYAIRHLSTHHTDTPRCRNRFAGLSSQRIALWRANRPFGKVAGAIIKAPQVVYG